MLVVIEWLDITPSRELPSSERIQSSAYLRKFYLA
jgi:hypothetical protein